MIFRAGSARVVWTRGKGCHELAEVLGGTDTSRIQGDLAAGCISERADLLVARKLPSEFDLVNVAVPIGFEPDRVSRVVATVAGGPHSVLAAQTARRLGLSMGVEAEMISIARDESEEEAALEFLDQVGANVPSMGRRVVRVDGISEMVDELDERTLLVLGAPGGSWLSRARTGPGARLRRTAQAGAIVVRSAPDRVFRFMGDPVYVAPLRLADDTLRMHQEGTLAVAEAGRLVGLVRRERLFDAGSGPVESVMEDAISVKQHDTIVEAWELEPTFKSDPIPVTDDEENLVGGLSLPAG